LTWTRGHRAKREVALATESKHKGCITTPGCVSRPLSPAPLLVWARRAIERASREACMRTSEESGRTRKTDWLHFVCLGDAGHVCMCVRARRSVAPKGAELELVGFDCVRCC
jgi:hypothetical protein